MRLLQISVLSLVNFARQTLVKLFRSDFAKKSETLKRNPNLSFRHHTVETEDIYR